MWSLWDINCNIYNIYILFKINVLTVVEAVHPRDISSVITKNSTDFGFHAQYLLLLIYVKGVIFILSKAYKL